MDAHQLKLIAAAQDLGIAVEDLSPTWRRDAVRYSYQDKSELVLDGRIYSYLDHQTEVICDDKYICKLWFQEIGIPVANGQVFTVSEGEDEADKDEIESQIADFFQAGTTYVCKPLYGTDGHAVAMHLTEILYIEDHVNAYRDTYATWLLEEQIPGDDLRIQAIGGELVAAAVRLPAYVTGDGILTLDELIATHNEKIAQQNPSNFVEIDGATRNLLREQDVFLGSVIEADRKIILKHVSNMGQGGVAEDVTDRLHPDYHDWIRRVAQRFNLRTFAFDAMTTDPSLPPTEATMAIEVNAKAQWLHHTFSEGRQHDIPGLILKDMFGIE